MTAIDLLRTLAEDGPFVAGLGDKTCQHIWIGSDASPVFKEWMRQAFKAQFRDACPNCGGTLRVEP